jgi:hypothetical protein
MWSGDRGRSETRRAITLRFADPVGRTIQIGSTNTDAQIVGVVKDSRYSDLREQPVSSLCSVCAG